MAAVASRMPSPADLQDIRKDAALTQEEVAARMRVSASKVSRLEAGVSGASEDEYLELLDAIGTPLAKRYREWMTYPWVHLEPVAFGHPDRDALEKAESILFQLGEMKAVGELKRPILQRIDSYEQQVRTAAQYLTSMEHSIAFIGRLGVGKSTAICSMSGLRRPAAGLLKFQTQMVLEAGPGGTTLCEVQIRQGPQYGLIIEPRPEDRVRQEVWDFAEVLIDKAFPRRSDVSSPMAEGPFVPRELAKAIRNMANLAETSTTTTGGKRERHDPALDLAREIGDARELAVRILSNMDMPRRDRRELWHEPGLDPLEWLQAMFEKVNTGKHREVALPQRVTVVLPEPIFSSSELAITLIDTKGIEQDVPREDIEKHFDDPRAIVVLCSGFKDAPDLAIQVLLERASQSGARGLLDRTSLLVLALPDEASSVKEDSGELVIDDVHGYEIKRGQVESELQRRGLLALPVEFYNAKSDDPTDIPKKLLGRTRALRDRQRQIIVDLAGDVEHLRENLQNAAVEETIREAVHRLRVWVDSRQQLAEIPEKAHHQLLGVMASIYASTVRASIRRRGEWPKLDFYYHLGFGARALGVKHMKPLVEEARAVINNMVEDPELIHARPFLKQVLDALDTKVEAQFKKLQVAGAALFEEVLKADAALWAECEQRWGDGPGYRHDIIRKNELWFESEARQAMHAQVGETLRGSWREVVDGVSKMLAAASASETNISQ
jgi:transcriptional regulator with XRE-family HTH domain